VREPQRQVGKVHGAQRLAAEIELQRERVRTLELAIAERRRLEEQELTRMAVAKEAKAQARFARTMQRNAAHRRQNLALSLQQDEQRRRDRQSQ
jgi:hypothetical protein